MEFKPFNMAEAMSAASDNAMAGYKMQQFMAERQRQARLQDILASSYDLNPSEFNADTFPGEQPLSGNYNINPTFNQNKYRDNLMAGGFRDEADKVNDVISKMNDDKRKKTKEGMQVIGSTLSGVLAMPKDKQQQAYEVAIKNMKEYGFDLSGLPKKFDPVVVEMNMLQMRDIEKNIHDDLDYTYGNFETKDGNIIAARKGKKGTVELLDAGKWIAAKDGKFQSLEFGGGNKSSANPGSPTNVQVTQAIDFLNKYGNEHVKNLPDEEKTNMARAIASKARQKMATDKTLTNWEEAMSVAYDEEVGKVKPGQEKSLNPFSDKPFGMFDEKPTYNDGTKQPEKKADEVPQDLVKQYQAKYPNYTESEIKAAILRQRQAGKK